MSKYNIYRAHIALMAIMAICAFISGLFACITSSVIAVNLIALFMISLVVLCFALIFWGENGVPTKSQKPAKMNRHTRKEFNKEQQRILLERRIFEAEHEAGIR